VSLLRVKRQNFGQKSFWKIQNNTHIGHILYIRSKMTMVKWFRTWGVPNGTEKNFKLPSHFSPDRDLCTRLRF
jgi:hypothetical protein